MFMNPFLWAKCGTLLAVTTCETAVYKHTLIKDVVARGPENGVGRASAA